MRQICTYILITASLNVFGQNTILIDKDSLDYFYIINYDTIFQIRRSFYKPRKTFERNRLLYVNHQLMDSSGIYFENPMKHYGGVVYGYQFDRSTKVSLIHKLDLDEGLTIVTKHSSFHPDHLLYSANENGKVNGEILRLSLTGGDITVFNDVEKFFNYNSVSGIGDEIWKLIELSPEELICETCEWNGGCLYFRYFYTTGNNVEEIDFDQLRLPYTSEFDPQYENFRVNLYLSHNDYNFLMAAVDYGNLPSNTDLLFSKDLDDTTHVIKKHQPWEIMGENIQQSKNQYFYLRSRLDDGEKVIVSYKMDKAFEKIAYQIFKGHLISKGQVKTFNKEQLSILKNLAFAKYNYAFNSDFYQAYFNLFEFYNHEKKRTSRTKDMTGLLTGADTKNLQVIRKALEKYD